MKAEKDLLHQARRRPTAAALIRTRCISLATALAAVLWVSGCNAPAGKNHYILAERLFSDHKYPAAVEEFQKLVEADPRSSLAHKALYRIGTIQYLYLESYQDSIKSFRQFIALSQDQDLVYQAEKNIAEIYFSKLEDYKLAIDQYKRLLDKYPESQERDFFMLRMAKSYYGNLDFKKAIEAYRDIVKKYPKSASAAEAYYQIGNSYYTKGDVDAAIEAFRDVMLYYPNTQQAVFADFGIANCYEEKDRFDEALEIYQKILDKHPARSVVEAKIRRLKERKNRTH